MHSKNNFNITGNQSGIVSITVTLIIMIILMLIVLGFAQISRREQRQVLDRQLSSQAFYAAETAITDANEAIKRELKDGLSALKFEGADAEDYTTDCDKFMDQAGLSAHKDLTADGVISYTCLLVDPDPVSLEYGNIDTNASRIVPVFSKDGSAINSISVGWQDKSGGNNVSGCSRSDFPDFPAADNWPADCDTGIMRLDLVPVGGNSLTRDKLMDSLATVFLHPWSSGGGATNEIAYTGGPAQPGFGQQGNIIRINCGPSAAAGSSKQCNVRINGLNGLNSNAFMLRLKSIYNPSVATVAASSSAGAVELKSAQAIIDATGKSNDVLRRVQVRVPIVATDLPFAEFSMQSMTDICKRFAFAPGQPIAWGAGSGCNLLD